MKNLIVLLLLFSSIFPIFSQTDALKNIRQQYSDVHRDIKAQKNEDIPKNHAQIIINQMMPSIGAQTIEYNFYFSLVEPVDDYSFDHYLSFATRKYNVAQSLFVYEEFLYDSDGNLIFYFDKELSQNCTELRCYFENNKLFKVLYKVADLEANKCPDASKYKTILNSKNELPEDFSLNVIKSSADDILTIYRLLDK